MKCLPQFYHHRICIRRSINSDFLLKCLMIPFIKGVKPISLRSGDPTQRLPGDILCSRCFVIFIDNKYLLVIGHRSDSITKLFCFQEDIRQHRSINQRAYPIMNNDDIISRRLSFKIIDVITNGFLPGITARYNPLQLCDIKLFRIGTKYIMPAINAYNLNRINLRMFLKSFLCINPHRLIIYINKLLRNILARSMSGSSSYDDSNVHIIPFPSK